ncbi:23S rRNA (adenine(2030)-N(6))-methyltransferase RlmJ [Parvularcula sp. LCG005]|uniref:23S rRNA (adenine(2030)-N(6))-methyltransferase RlmJ n=1 Tax=Parvularcula sp. LCG005 TaxID=3078805 RepID=UPI00294252B9|nr:23S rRNA (adenine(2030)-N(6))-methyltransferase RlmJ [Parvularcula sp. LCG005]WOI52735.1 23S rRNA (adenine(2030)-N(6))-methyltransferase RlmJ [Parvularcula sp. LCG005]
MLSYQHAYHAGNPADLHKHIVLCELLRLLTEKDRGISYIETHAGRALYDLTSAEAQKTGEATEGIRRLTMKPDTPYARALAEVRAMHGDSAYAGSPLLASQLLRSQDRIVLMELHPAENAALKENMRGGWAEIHKRDGYEGLMAIAPPSPRKGLVLIDPAYEVKTEYDEVANFIPKLMKKWPEASILLWYPILAARRHDAMADALSSLPHIRHEVSFTLKGGKGMTGSGLILINPPWQSEAAFDASLAQSEHILEKC